MSRILKFEARPKQLVVSSSLLYPKFDTLWRRKAPGDSRENGR
jgi:hypothetical protein